MCVYLQVLIVCQFKFDIRITFISSSANANTLSGVHVASTIEIGNVKICIYYPHINLVIYYVNLL